jgi:hypothetical protein
VIIFDEDDNFSFVVLRFSKFSLKVLICQPVSCHDLSVTFCPMHARDVHFLPDTVLESQKVQRNFQIFYREIFRSFFASEFF